MPIEIRAMNGQRVKNMDVSPGQRKRKGRGVAALALVLAVALSVFLSNVWAAGPKIPFNIPAGKVATRAVIGGRSGLAAAVAKDAECARHASKSDRRLTD